MCPPFKTIVPGLNLAWTQSGLNVGANGIYFRMAILIVAAEKTAPFVFFIQ